MAISAVFPTLEFGHRGVDSRTTFVTKQELGQDTLAGSWTIAANLFKSEANALEANVNAKEATVVAKEALISPHYAAIDSVYANATIINSVVTNILDIQNAEENALLAISAKDSAIIAKNDALAAAAAATLTANVTKWVSGTTYAEGSNTWSPMSFYTYRRKITGAGTTDPSLDSLNWLVQRPLFGIDSETIAIVGSYQITNINKIAINFSITANATVTLPDATTIPTSVVKYLYNSSNTYYIQVNDFGGNYKFTLSPNTQAIVTCVDVSTANGVWKEQTKILFNPVFSAPAVDIVSSLDSNSTTDATSILKHSIATSNYYTLFYKNTSSYPAIQSIQVTGNTTITFGTSTNIIASALYYPAGAVALDPSLNKGVCLYWATGAIYCKTFTNTNGTLAIGTQYQLGTADMRPLSSNGDNSQSAPSNQLCRISSTEIAFCAFNTTNNYRYVFIFSTVTNTFSADLVGVTDTTAQLTICNGIDNGILYALKVNPIAGGVINIYKYSISGIVATEIGTARYLYNLGSTGLRNGASLCEVGYDKLAFCLYDATSLVSTFRVVDTTVASNGTINGSVLTFPIKSTVIRKIRNNTIAIYGTDLNGILCCYIVEYDSYYKCTITGASTFIGGGVDGSVQAVDAVVADNTAISGSGSMVCTFADDNSAGQHRIINVQTK